MSFIILFFSTSVVWSQDLYIEGHVQDDTGLPLPYATLMIYDADSAMVDGLSTDEEGYFKSVLDAPGIYTLHFQYLSFSDHIIENLKVTTEPVTLEEITMTSGDLVLDEIQVTAERSQMELKLDKRVVNVGSDLANAGSNVADLLDNIPSVDIDVEGNVGLRGSQNVRILIDGKPSGLLGNNVADALRQLQSDMVERVEIITNPSARYDAEGEVGIINLVMKKESRRGLHGSVDLRAGNPHNYGAGINFNLRREWVNLFLNGGLYYMKSPGSASSYQRFDGPEGVQIYESETDRFRSRLSNQYQFGADFYLNEYNTLTASGMYRFSDGNNETDIHYEDFTEGKKLIGTSRRLDQENRDGYDMETALSYEKSFKDQDRKLTADFKWMQNHDLELSDIEENIFHTNRRNIFQRSENEEGEETFLLQADYTDPIGQDGMFEAGIKVNLRDIKNNFLVEEMNEEDQWGILPGYNDNLTYFENIFAAYSIYGNKSGQFSYQVGLRVEHSDITTRLENENMNNDRNYTDFFPTAHFTYELDPENQFQLNYSRRLSRPWFRMLMPFSNFSNNRSRWMGNPNLDPEYSHSIETGFLKYFQSGSLLSSLYYRHRTGVIERLRQINDEGIELRVPVNLGIQNAYGVELNFNYDFLKWLRYDVSLNFYQAITEGQYLEQDFYSNARTMTGRTSTKLKLPKEFDMQLSFFYRAPRATTQGRRDAMYSLDAGISKDILNNNGTLILNGRDLLNTRKFSGYSEGPDFYSEEESVWRNRQITLTFNYRINQKKSEKPDGSGDDRMGDGDFGS